MGNGQWAMENKEAAVSDARSILIGFFLCPMPNAQCPLPNSLL